MAVLNTKYGYLFLAEPETGSRAAAAAMLQHDGHQHVPGHHITHWQVRQKGCLEDVVIFSVVRNPLDILVTRTLKGQHHSLRQHICRCAGKRFYYHYGCDRLLRYERGLESELNKFFKSIGAPSIHLDVIGKSINKTSWETYYSEADLEIAKLLIPEIEAYGYG